MPDNGEMDFEYGGLPVPVVPDPPQPVLSWWRRNRATGEVEYKPVGDLEPGARVPESREGFNPAPAPSEPPAYQAPQP